MTDVLFLCTGNAARSVMAGVALATRRHDLRIATAGTLVIDGQPMSIRTRAAIEGVGLPLPRHSSRQASIDQMDEARLLVALAPEHVEWVRRVHSPAAARTATLKRLTRHLVPGDDLDVQVERLDLARVELGGWEEVVDPGGGETEVFAACAREIDALIEELAPLLGR